MNNPNNKLLPIRLFASFDRNIFIPLVAPNNTPEIIHQRLKAMGARIGRDSVADLIDGKVEMVKDFQVVSVNDRHDRYDIDDVEDKEEQVRSPVTHSVPVNTVTQAQKTEPIPVYHEPEKKSAVLRTSHKRKGKARSLGYLPTKTLRPIRRGTVYAKLMERLISGATLEELKTLSGNSSLGGVNNMLWSKLREHGYGLRLDPSTEKYFIIYPRGITELIYETREGQ